MENELYHQFTNRAESHGDRPFLRLLDREISYEDTLQQARQYGSVLAETEGDVIGLLMDNRPEFIYTLLGALSRNTVVACINTEMRGEGLQHLVDKANISTLVSTDELLEDVEEILEESGVSETFSVTSGSQFTEMYPNDIEAIDPPEHKPAVTDTAVLLHTSGTTGLPKWCDLSHRYFARLGEYVAERFDMTPVDTVFNPLPLYHINPLGYYFFGGVHAGATLGLVDRFSVSGFWEQVRELEATIVILHMAPKNMILERTDATDARHHTLRVVFPADRTFMRRYDIPKMVTGYGSTEAGGFTHTNTFTHIPEGLPDEEDLSAFAGQPRRDVSIRIVSDDGTEVPQGTTGEILVRPDTEGVIFDGYFEAPDRTVDAWTGLWFNTGDLGYLDEEDNLHFVGRIADSISHKGEFVNVDLVESRLESHPSIRSAIVVGVPDEVVGERVKACVIPESEVDPGQLLEDIQGDLPRYMVPEYVEFLEEFPRIEGTEKINRTVLSERGIDRAHHCPQ